MVNIFLHYSGCPQGGVRLYYYAKQGQNKHRGQKTRHYKVTDKKRTEQIQERQGQEQLLLLLEAKQKQN